MSQEVVVTTTQPPEVVVVTSEESNVLVEVSSTEPVVSEVQVTTLEPPELRVTVEPPLPEVRVEVAEVAMAGRDGTDGSPGVPGPPGPPGIDGAATRSELQFGFASPAVIWNLPHNLNGSVNVEVFDQNGETLDVNVEYPDEDTAVVYFYYPTAGHARVFR